MDLLVTLIIIIITFLTIHKIYKEYKMSRTIDEKLLFWLAVIIFFTPTIIYYIDRYDIPTKFGWLKNDEPQKWFNFISNYVSSIIGATIGAIALILMTIHEFKVLKENENEQMRINNLPIIDYGFSICDDYNATSFIDLYNASKKYDHLFIIVNLKNIGMNTIRKCYINISSNIISSEFDYKIDDQPIIQVNSEKQIVFKLPISEKDNELKLIIKYQDILFNWYKQEVDVSLKHIIFHKDDRDYVDSVSADIIKVVNDEFDLGKKITLKIT